MNTKEFKVLESKKIDEYFLQYKRNIFGKEIWLNVKEYHFFGYPYFKFSFYSIFILVFLFLIVETLSPSLTRTLFGVIFLIGLINIVVSLFIFLLENKTRYYRKQTYISQSYQEAIEELRKIHNKPFFNFLIFKEKRKKKKSKDEVIGMIIGDKELSKKDLKRIKIFEQVI